MRALAVAVRLLLLTTLALGMAFAIVLAVGFAQRPAVQAPPPEPRPSPTDAPPAPLAGRVVVLDPGHQLGNGGHAEEINAPVEAGGFEKACNTTGAATDGGYPESTLVFEVATLVRQRLEAAGARVVMTRATDSADLWGPCVDVRGRAGNDLGADLKLSIHADGSRGGGPGFHVIAPTLLDGWTDDIAATSWDAALLVRDALVVAGLPRAAYVAEGEGLHRRADLATLNLSDVPAVMVELGNMRDPEDARRMTTAAGRRQYADALAAAVVSYLEAG